MEITIYSISDIMGNIVIDWCKENAITFGYDYDAFYDTFSINIEEVESVYIRRIRDTKFYGLNYYGRAIEIPENDFERIEIQ